MKELLLEIERLVLDFKTDSTQQEEKCNKSAGVRARKLSLEIEKRMKTFRKLSLDKSKDH